MHTSPAQSRTDDELATSLERLRHSTCDSERALLEDEIVRGQLPMARSLARRYAGRGADLEDLVAVAGLALVKAVRGFEPTRGSFQAYAVATILGEIKKHFRDHCWSVRPTRRIQELQAEIVHMTDERVQRGEFVRAEAIAERIGADVPEVTEALQAFSHFTSTSLDAPSSPGGAVLGDRIAVEDDDLERVDQRLLAIAGCEQLTPDECRLLRLRFVEDHTQSEIAEIVGTSQVQVSRHLARALRTLRRAIGEVAS